jgi:hypothetical protein
MKTLFLIFILLLNFNFIEAQKNLQKTGTNCSFKNELLGKWSIENMVNDLSGENLETEGQSWKLSTTDNSEIKDKITMTFSPDGTFTGATNVNDSIQVSYGYWSSSEDCKSLLIEVDGIVEVLAIFSIEKQYLVLKVEDDFKMIFRKLKL